MKRRPSKSPTAGSGNPSVVLRAFAPETCFTLSLDGWILLEAMQSPYAGGGTIQMRDSVILMLAMIDVDALEAARRMGPKAVDDLVLSVSKGRRPAEIVALRPKLEAAVAAALDPISTDTEAPEKKSSPEPAGG
jgi:hypothetical protein